MITKQQNKELVVNDFITEKVEVHDNEFLLYRTKQSGDVWQFRIWNGTEQAYIRKSTRQRDIERAKRIGTQIWKEILVGQKVETVNAKPKRIRKNKGNSILEEHLLFDGEIKVFRVEQSSKVWQVYIWIREEQKAIKKSLKTRDLDLARERARNIYLDYIAKARNNQPIFDRKAKELAEAFVEYQMRRCKQGSITKQFVNTLSARMKHYLRFVGESTALTRIKEDYFKGYRLFRKEVAPNVTLMTLYNERGTIKALYKFSKEKNFIQIDYEPKFGEWEKITRSGEKINRDALEIEEWRLIYTYLHKWAGKKYARNDKQAEQRRFLKEFIFILCNSGIRFGEARRLQWKDVKIYYDEVIEDGKDIKKSRCEIHLSASKTKTGKARLAISRLGNPFIRLKKLSNYTSANDYLFVDNDTGQKLHKKVYYKEWRELMNETGLNESHKKIVYYCLRHTYATFQLYKGVDVFKLSQVMGCGVDFIQKHYGHIDIERIKREFTRDFEFSESGQEYYLVK